MSDSVSLAARAAASSVFAYRCLRCRQLIEYHDMQAHFWRAHLTRVYGIDLRAQFRREVAPCR